MILNWLSNCLIQHEFWKEKTPPFYYVYKLTFLQYLLNVLFIMFFLNTIFVSSHMYPENPEGTQVIVGSMNMGYISDTARNRTHNCTGCHSWKECSSSCALLSTSASINWHQCTWVNCAYLSELCVPVFHAPRQISSTFGCHWWPTCSSDSNKNNWSTWIFLIWSIRMELEAYWHEGWNTLLELFQKKTQNFSFCGSSRELSWWL